MILRIRRREKQSVPVREEDWVAQTMSGDIAKRGRKVRCNTQAQVDNDPSGALAQCGFELPQRDECITYAEKGRVHNGVAYKATPPRTLRLACLFAVHYCASSVMSCTRLPSGPGGTIISYHERGGLETQRQLKQNFCLNRILVSGWKKKECDMSAC